MTNICNTIQAVPLIEKWFTRRHDNTNKSKKLIQQAILLIKITFGSQSQQNLMENSKTYLAASDTCIWDHEDQLVVWQLESTTSNHRLISHFFTQSPKSWENSNETTRTTRWERAIPCGPSREYCSGKKVMMAWKLDTWSFARTTVAITSVLFIESLREV